MGRLLDNTVVVGQDGSAVALLAGATVPDWAADQVGAHLIASADEVPPTRGPGSSLAAWQAYAEGRGVDPTGTRDDIIARFHRED